MHGKWLGNGWGVSNLCALLRGIPGRGPFLPQKSAPFHKKCLFLCLYDKTSPFIIKRPDPGPFLLRAARNPDVPGFLLSSSRIPGISRSGLESPRLLESLYLPSTCCLTFLIPLRVHARGHRLSRRLTCIHAHISFSRRKLPGKTGKFVSSTYRVRKVQWVIEVESQQQVMIFWEKNRA